MGEKKKQHTPTGDFFRNQHSFQGAFLKLCLAIGVQHIHSQQKQVSANRMPAGALLPSILLQTGVKPDSVVLKKPKTRGISICYQLYDHGQFTGLL